MIEELERPSSSAAGNCIGKTEKYVRPLSISIRPASAAMLGLVRADEDDAVAIDYLSQYCLGKPALNVSFGLLCDHEAWYWKSNHTFDSTQWLGADTSYQQAQALCFCVWRVDGAFQ